MVSELAPMGNVAKSTHVSEAILDPLLQPTFDAADYLNATLPALSITAPTSTRDQSERASVSELSSKLTILLTQLNAQTSRLSNTLTTLTDEIIRGGSRLAYEVEILRGEANGLSEVLSQTLAKDISQFTTVSDSTDPSNTKINNEDDPIQRLRTLTQVRTQLDAVIQVFGNAMEWPLAPSELSSSLISVTAPSITPEEIRQREDNGRNAATKLRNEITGLLDGNGEGLSEQERIDAAEKRIEQLRSLSTVWKGTAEEKVRARFLDSLSKLVEEEQRRVSKRAEGRRVGSPAVTAGSSVRNTTDTRQGGEAGYGFMNSLRKMRGDIYMD